MYHLNLTNEDHFYMQDAYKKEFKVHILHIIVSDIKYIHVEFKMEIRSKSYKCICICICV